MSNIETFIRRAKRKYINTPVLKHLAALDSPLKDKYIGSFQCSSSILISGGVSKSRYCKRPWCNICNSIRTAVRLNRYEPELVKLDQLYMTTLTMPNVGEAGIAKAVQFFKKTFMQFRNTHKKKTGQMLKGTYSLEITYNAKTNTYHPHIHILHEYLPINVVGHQSTIIKKEYENNCKFYYISNITYANAIVRYWLSHCPGALLAAQDTRPCTDLIEAFKYAAKGIGKIRVSTEQGSQKVPVIYAAELDKIYQSIAGLRMFQPFGLPKINNEIDEDQEMDALTAQTTELSDAIYKWNIFEWYTSEVVDEPIIDYETGELQGLTIRQLSTPLHLSGFAPKKKIRALYEQYDKNEHYGRKDA